MRLGQIKSHQVLAKDLADVFVGGLNGGLSLNLKYEYSPDEIEHQSKAPDYIYTDERTSLSIVLEVTRLYDKNYKKRSEAWLRFSRRVREKMPQAAPEYFVITVSGDMKELPEFDACDLVVEKLSTMKESSLSLESVFNGGVRALRLDLHPETVTIESLVLQRETDFSDKYVENLRESNSKLESYHKEGYETFLLYDARMMDTLPSVAIECFDNWHDIAYQSEISKLGDPMSYSSLCPFNYSYFSEIDHIIVLGLNSSGVEAASLWKHTKCRLGASGIPTTIKPAGWYDD
jgi:hypothetical protein